MNIITENNFFADISHLLSVAIERWCTLEWEQVKWGEQRKRCDKRVYTYIWYREAIGDWWLSIVKSTNRL